MEEEIIIYARKSVERINSISCETQVEYCKSVIKPDERNLKVTVIIDNGFSGGNVDRDGFQRMMKLIRKGRVRKVIVYKLDRISRSLSDFVDILQEFKIHNVEFVSSQESFDTSSPYGEMLVKLLMVFAEFERTSTINRVTQAYMHRSEMGFYMGGRQPYGFELVPTVIHNIKTKKLNPIPSEIQQIHYIFEIYSQESISLRRLMDILIKEGKKPLNGSEWSTSKLSTLLKNPIYVKADSDVYDYYEKHGVQMITDISLFTGKCGAQLYGRNTHNTEAEDWSDMRLVLMTHEGVVDSDIWLKCQHKLEKNKQIGNSISNRTSWLSGKVFCEKCGYAMTTIKGKIGKDGNVRRYFNCTGKSHKRVCTGTTVSIYAEELENFVYDCISDKLAELKGKKHSASNDGNMLINDLKLQIKAIEKAEKQLMDTMLSGGFNDELLALANQKATQLKNDKAVLYERIEEVKDKSDEICIITNLARYWKAVDYQRKKDVVMIMIHKIVISEDGTIKIVWNI